MRGHRCGRALLECLHAGLAETFQPRCRQGRVLSTSGIWPLPLPAFHRIACVKVARKIMHGHGGSGSALVSLQEPRIQRSRLVTQDGAMPRGFLSGLESGKEHSSNMTWITTSHHARQARPFWMCAVSRAAEAYKGGRRETGVDSTPAIWRGGHRRRRAAALPVTQGCDQMV